MYRNCWPSRLLYYWHYLLVMLPISKWGLPVVMHASSFPPRTWTILHPWTQRYGWKKETRVLCLSMRDSSLGKIYLWDLLQYWVHTRTTPLHGAHPVELFVSTGKFLEIQKFSVCWGMTETSPFQDWRNMRVGPRCQFLPPTFHTKSIEWLCLCYHEVLLSASKFHLIQASPESNTNVYTKIYWHLDSSHKKAFEKILQKFEKGRM